jgi:hypothetical protein
MRDSRHQAISPEDRTYAAHLALVTHRLNALLHGDDDDSTAGSDFLEAALGLRDEAQRCKRDDVDEALRLLAQAAILLTAAEGRAKADRETMKTPTLREYTVIFAIVSELYRRFDQDVRTRIGRAYVDQVKESVENAINARHDGDIDHAVQYLYRAAKALGKAKMVEETYGPHLVQLQQWYDVVVRGVEQGSEADACLNRFIIAVDILNDWIAVDDTDNAIEAFDMAVELLKDATAARPRS